MSPKSFYDLDYIIETNEKRLENVYSVYQKVLERFTNIILIYSAIAIFLVSLVQDIFWDEISNIVFHISFYAFSGFFVASFIFTIRLLIPVKIAYLDPPKKYYESYRLEYEKTIKDKNQIADLLKASYIDELETALDENSLAFRKKSHFYYSALTYALLSVIPYLICLGFHVSRKEDKTHKVEIVKWQKISILHKIDSMSSDKSHKSTSSTTTTATTQLPGVNNAQVIPSSPSLIKENSHTPSNKKK